MSLVKLKDTKGNIMYFNPDHVLLLSGSVKDGAPICWGNRHRDRSGINDGCTRDFSRGCRST